MHPMAMDGSGVQVGKVTLVGSWGTRLDEMEISRKIPCWTNFRSVRSARREMKDGAGSGRMQHGRSSTQKLLVRYFGWHPPVSGAFSEG